MKILRIEIINDIGRDYLLKIFIDKDSIRNMEKIKYYLYYQDKSIRIPYTSLKDTNEKLIHEVHIIIHLDMINLNLKYYKKAMENIVFNKSYAILNLKHEVLGKFANLIIDKIHLD